MEAGAVWQQVATAVAALVICYSTYDTAPWRVPHDGDQIAGKHIATDLTTSLNYHILMGLIRYSRYRQVSPLHGHIIDIADPRGSFPI